MKIGLIFLLFLIAVTLVLKATSITAMSPLMIFIGAFGLIVICAIVVLMMVAKQQQDKGQQ